MTRGGGADAGSDGRLDERLDDRLGGGARARAGLVGRPSQVLVEEDRAEGELADWLERRRSARLALSYVPGERVVERHVRDGVLPWAGPPSVTWSVGDRGGWLSPLSFVACWNEGLRELAGRALEMRVEPGDGIALPWVWWHPSGCHQAVRFDIESSEFRRRVLYPTTG